MSGMDLSVGARNRRGGGRQAIDSGGIAEHSTKEWSWVGCNGIRVLAVFPSLNFELPVPVSTWPAGCFPEELYCLAGEECQYTHRVPGIVGEDL